ncbi:hypothetical protein IWX49DRAFT_306686 [Phyllosticta citricarpa]
MASKDEAELKQQGAVEAAQDPNSIVSPEDAEEKVVKEAKKAGGAALAFDPDASPEEKAAQARSVSALSSHNGEPSPALELDCPSPHLGPPRPRMAALGDSFLVHDHGPLALKLAPGRCIDQSTDVLLLPACPFRLSP